MSKWCMSRRRRGKQIYRGDSSHWARSTMTIYWFSHKGFYDKLGNWIFTSTIITTIFIRTITFILLYSYQYAKNAQKYAQKSLPITHYLTSDSYLCWPSHPSPASTLDKSPFPSFPQKTSLSYRPLSQNTSAALPGIIPPFPSASCINHTALSGPDISRCVSISSKTHMPPPYDVDTRLGCPVMRSFSTFLSSRVIMVRRSFSCDRHGLCSARPFLRV